VKTSRHQIDFKIINRAALPVLPAILRRLLPGGQIIGGEWVARNPTRADRQPGSYWRGQVPCLTPSAALSRLRNGRSK
jgi:hypothetical protein